MTLKSILVLLVLLLCSAPVTSSADDAPQQPADAAAQSVEGDGAAAEGMVPGCPGAEDGKCCGACQQRARLTKKPASEMGGCPCQRARQARESQ